MTDILLICGTRPECIKLGPVAAELAALGANWRCLLTGQHTSLLLGTPAESDLAGAHTLALASDGNVARWMTYAQERLTAYLREAQPKLVVVQGDTMSAHVGAVTATLLGIPVAHVEAGVRSHDLNNPWPEESTRVSIAQLARWHYAPTTTAFANLMQEGIPENQVRLTGNTSVSALTRYVGNVQAHPRPDQTIMVTLHRREIQHEAVANLLYGAVRHQAFLRPQVRFVWPLHPAMAKVVKRLQEPVNLAITEPLGYPAFVRLVADSLGVLTDSGGLVEECATLGVPCVILRAVNDRPEAVDAGCAVLLSPTAAGVGGGTRLLLDGVLQRGPSCVFGFSDAARQVAKHLVSVTNEAWRII